MFTEPWFGVTWQPALQAVVVVKALLLKARQMKLSVVFSVILGFVGAGPVLADMLLQRGQDARLLLAQAVVTPDPSKRVLQLSATMQIAEILSVMRQEGFDYGKSLEEEMFPGKGGAAWSATVDLIYNEASMKTVFDTALVAELAAADPATIDVMEAFFGSERGQRILKLEIEARRALLDQGTEDAAKMHVEELAAKDDPRLEVIRKFADANDLIEMNVAGALNANLAFFKGLADGGGFEEQMTEAEMLTNVWSQEPAIRKETQTWLYPYLALAYQPLSDDDMAAYLAFSELAEGKILNAAIFAAFNTLFSDISGNLGRAAAKQMRGEDI
jgi:Uncharacterized protein conserved in bacteria (DUF2059)